jgi:hypothetical protein
MRFMEEQTRCRDHEHRQRNRARPNVEEGNEEEFIASDDEEDDDDEEREQHWKRVADQGEGQEREQQGEEGSPSATRNASRARDRTVVPSSSCHLIREPIAHCSTLP